jgi:mRNA-degrading endonuclease toxin of MazEF toxin-antitoxin module
MVKRRDIILARVFFSDSSESKIRPAIVLSNDKYHCEDFLLAASITTAKDGYCVPISEGDVDCFLDKNSNARFDGIIKLNKKQAVKAIGKTSQEFHAKLVDKIVGMIAYNRKD